MTAVNRAATESADPHKNRSGTSDAYAVLDYESLDPVRTPVFGAFPPDKARSSLSVVKAAAKLAMSRSRSLDAGVYDLPLDLIWRCCVRFRLKSNCKVFGKRPICQPPELLC